MSTLRVGAVGVLLRLTVREDGAAKDVSTATTKQIKLRKPDGTVVTYAASFTAAGVDGQIQAATVSGDLDLVGRYTYCAYVAIGTWADHGSATAFEVRAVGQ